MIQKAFQSEIDSKKQKKSKAYNDMMKGAGQSKPIGKSKKVPASKPDSMFTMQESDVEMN